VDVLLLIEVNIAKKVGVEVGIFDSLR